MIKIRLPNGFSKEIEEILGDNTPVFIEALENGTARPGLRVNTLKISVADFLQISPWPLEQIPWCQEGFYYPQEARPAKHHYYHAGLYYLQEPSAMAPAAILDPKPGDRVLDLCAAPGGKSLQIAARLQGKGFLVTNDLYPDRLKALTRNIEQSGVGNATILNETPQRLAKNFADFFDKILVDAPCSGEGMFRKDGRAVLGWEEYPPIFCHRRQIGILEEASRLLKPGGYLVYSTCTFNRQENEEVIKEFLNNNQDYEGVILEPFANLVNGEVPYSLRLWPHRLEGEGHFVAKLHRKGSSEPKENIGSGLASFPEILKEFWQENIKLPTDNYTYTAYGDHCFLVPRELPSLDGLKVSRPGLFLGEFKTKRFEPSQALIMALTKEQIQNTISFERGDREISIYLRGQTFPVEGKSGWVGVFMDRFPLGWGKVSNGVLKNHYPKAWRLI